MDSIRLSSQRLQYRPLVATSKLGLITAGDYPKRTLSSLDSIVVEFNAPWVVSQIRSYTITVLQGGEVLLHQQYRGASLRHPAIQRAISRLKRGGTIEIEQINASMPYDCGDRPAPIRLVCR